MGSQISTAGAINSIINQSDRIDASSGVLKAIKSASSITGVDFSYLVQKASQESSLDPLAKASTSSATGLFQFTSQTWLDMVKKYGDDHGLGNYASQITRDSDGYLSVPDAAAKKAILALRKDPQISAVMAGELDKENAAYLQKRVGGKIGATELYLAHFLGATGAANFIREMRKNPAVAAADLLPSAAEANRSVFYGKSGEAKSLRQIYQKFAQKFDGHSTQIAGLSSPAAASRLSGMSTVAVAKALSSSASALPQATFDLDEAAALHTQIKSGGAKVASNTSSTLFNAMIIGQVQGSGLDMTSPSAAFMQSDESKKKSDDPSASALG